MVIVKRNITEFGKAIQDGNSDAIVLRCRREQSHAHALAFTNVTTFAGLQGYEVYVNQTAAHDEHDIVAIRI